MGRLPKHPDQRQRRNKTGTVVELRAVTAPAPTEKWEAATKTDWTEFFSSPVASLIIDADMPALRRLFDYRDEHARALRAYKAKRVVKGSMGQDRVSTFADQIARLEKLMAPLEDRFGLSPMSRLKLQVQFADAASSLDRVNAALEGDEEDDNGEEDPRVKLA